MTDPVKQSKYKCPECDGVIQASKAKYKQLINEGKTEDFAIIEAQKILNGDWVNCTCGAGNEILFEWEVPEDYPNFTTIDDIAEAYRVVENEKSIRWNCCLCKISWKMGCS